MLLATHSRRLMPSGSGSGRAGLQARVGDDALLGLSGQRREVGVGDGASPVAGDVARDPLGQDPVDHAGTPLELTQRLRRARGDHRRARGGIERGPERVVEARES